MSIHTITVDEFMQLTLPQHRQALALYDREIDALQSRLQCRNADGSPVGATKYVSLWQQELENYQKLREVHHNRIQELLAAASETDGSTAAIAA